MLAPHLSKNPRGAEPSPLTVAGAATARKPDRAIVPPIRVPFSPRATRTTREEPTHKVKHGAGVLASTGGRRHGLRPSRTRVASLTRRHGNGHCRSMTNPMAILRRRPFGLMAAVLLALTASLLGFAHRPIAIATATFASSVQILPDGMEVELCHSDLGEDASGAPVRHDARTAVCDACLLSGAPGLPETAASVPVPVGGLVIVVLAIADQVVIGRSPLAAASRGPPASA